MDIVTRVAQAMQSVLEESATKVERSSGVIQRVRKFTGRTLAQTLVFGFLSNPRASGNDLACCAAKCGVDVSPQAIDQRFTPALVTFLQALVLKAVEQVVAAEASCCELLRRFNGVYLTDSTTLQLPDEYAEQWPGCGGDGGAAGLKLQLRLDWLTGSISHLLQEPARDPDQKTRLQQVSHPRGALRLADLGYFCLKTLGNMAAEGVYFISRIQSRTTVFETSGQPRVLLAWLTEQWCGEALDLPVLLGAQARLACRLLACRVPEEVASRRRQKLRETCLRKGRAPSQERLAWCDWTIFVTNVEPARLTWSECVVLYRTRWQIELIFKLWKSEGQLAKAIPGAPHRRMAVLLARLLAMIFAHWLLLCSVWHLPDRSLRKAAQYLRSFALCLAGSLCQPQQLVVELAALANALKRVAKINKRRKKPSHYQLLENPQLLEYALT